MEIYIGFSKSTKTFAIGSWLISEVEKRQYSHAFIRYSCPITGEPMAFQASHGLVNEMHLDIFLQKNKIIKEYSLQIDFNKFLEFYKFVKTNMGKEYSVFQLISIGIKKIFAFSRYPKYIYSLIQNGTSEYICSEIAACVCMLVNDTLRAALIDTQIDEITPSDLESILIENNIPEVANG